MRTQGLGWIMAGTTGAQLKQRKQQECNKEQGLSDHPRSPHKNDYIHHIYSTLLDLRGCMHKTGGGTALQSVS